MATIMTDMANGKWIMRGRPNMGGSVDTDDDDGNDYGEDDVSSDVDHEGRAPLGREC